MEVQPVGGQAAADATGGGPQARNSFKRIAGHHRTVDRNRPGRLELARQWSAVASVVVFARAVVFAVEDVEGAVEVDVGLAAAAGDLDLVVALLVVDL